MNWFPPRDGVYTMYPVNHPSVLIQWRILIRLLSLVIHEQRAQFRGFGRGYVPQHRREQSRVTTTSGKLNTRSRGMPRTVEKTRVTRPARDEPSARMAKTSDTPQILDAREIINRKHPAEPANRSYT